MNELTLDEIVALTELRRQQNPTALISFEVSALMLLIASWRERGEALREIRENNRHAFEMAAIAQIALANKEQRE